MPLARTLSKPHEELAPSEVQTETFLTESKTGEILFCKRVSRVSSVNPRLRVLCLHDVGSYHKTFDSFTEQLLNNTDKDLDILSFDLVGHGRSTGARAHFDNVDDLVADTNTIISKFIQKDTNDELLIVGDGYGGTLSLLSYFNSKKIARMVDGVILFNPLFRFEKIPSNRLRKKEIWMPEIFKRIRIPRKIEKSAAHMSDPLTANYLTLGVLKEMQKGMGQIHELAYFMDSPTLFYLDKEVGEKSVSAAEQFSKSVGPNYSTFRTYDATHHTADENEKDKWFGNLYTWMEDNLFKGM